MDKLKPLAETTCLLFYRIKTDGLGCLQVEAYEKVFDPQDDAKKLLNQVSDAIADRDNWKTKLSNGERVAAEIVSRREHQSYLVKFFCVGCNGSSNSPPRIASYFILDPETKRPVLSGYVDYPFRETLKGFEDFFHINKDSVDREAKTSWKRWEQWASKSFVVEHELTPVLRLSVEHGEHHDCRETYLVVSTKAEIRAYPEGYAQGGVPLGSEDQFLAIADIRKPEQWIKALEMHQPIWASWNHVCQDRNVKSVFLLGEPGSGKDLWWEAIKGGAVRRESGKWKSLAATLETRQLRSLLYGERQGGLERPGYLKECDGGHLFLDEIGKSSKLFRSDLLRVLESREFVPLGGVVERFESILFVFASTPKDREGAGDPPDFWTRMDVEMRLPDPIKIRRGWTNTVRISDLDVSRFRALFFRFWFENEAFKQSLWEHIDRMHEHCGSLDKEVFGKVLSLLRSKKIVLSRNIQSIYLSPRRVRSLALGIAASYRWLRQGLESVDADCKVPAEMDFDYLLKHQVELFVAGIVSDATYSAAQAAPRP